MHSHIHLSHCVHELGGLTACRPGPCPKHCHTPSLAGRDASTNGSRGTIHLLLHLLNGYTCTVLSQRNCCRNVAAWHVAPTCSSCRAVPQRSGCGTGTGTGWAGCREGAGRRSCPGGSRGDPWAEPPGWHLQGMQTGHTSRSSHQQPQHEGPGESAGGAALNCACPSAQLHD
jgi:hypothetical protein